MGWIGVAVSAMDTISIGNLGLMHQPIKTSKKQQPLALGSDFINSRTRGCQRTIELLGCSSRKVPPIAWITHINKHVLILGNPILGLLKMFDCFCLVVWGSWNYLIILKLNKVKESCDNNFVICRTHNDLPKVNIKMHFGCNISSISSSIISISSFNTNHLVIFCSI